MGVRVLFPPVSVAEDFIDYPYFADLGAVQLATVLRARGHDVTLVDAFALPAAGLHSRTDGRLHMGGSVEAVLDAGGGPFEAAVVAYTPFHRLPHRDDVLAPVLEGLRRSLPRASLLLADLYQSGQHYVQVPAEAVLRAYPEIDAYVQYEGEATVPALLEANARASGAYRGQQPDLAELPVPDWSLVDTHAY